MQGCLAVLVDRLKRRALVEEELHHVNMAIRRCFVQRPSPLAAAAAAIDVCARREQSAHHVRVALGCGNTQWACHCAIARKVVRNARVDRTAGKHMRAKVGAMAHQHSRVLDPLLDR